MFTQFALSLDSSNYIFKIKLDEKAIVFFKENNKKIIEHSKQTESLMTRDEYEGEVIGFAYTEVQKDFMLKEMNKWMKFFENNGLEVYEAKITTLKDRLKELEKIDLKNKEKIKECYF